MNDELKTVREMPVRPIQGYLVVKALPVPERTRSGLLFIPDKHRISACVGLVLAMGCGKFDKKARVTIPMPDPVAPGCFIIYDSCVTTDISYGGEQFVLLHQDGILAICTTAPDFVEVEEVTSQCERYFGRDFVRETLAELKREQRTFVEDTVSDQEATQQPKERLNIEEMKKFQVEGFNAPLKDV